MIKKRVLHSLIALITMVGFIFMLSPSLEASAQEETAPVPSEILDTLSPKEQVIIKRIAPTIKDSWGLTLARDLRGLQSSTKALTPVETAKMTLIQHELAIREQISDSQESDKLDLYFNVVIVLGGIAMPIGFGVFVYTIYKYHKQLYSKKKDVKTHDVT